jgi:methionyl-tRNA formyltransferase
LHRAIAEKIGGETDRSAGEILEVSAQGICVSTGRGCLNIKQLQKPGGKVLHVRDFLNGFSLKPGQRFE